MDKATLTAWLHELGGLTGMLSGVDEDTSHEIAVRVAQEAARRLRALWTQGTALLGQDRQ